MPFMKFPPSSDEEDSFLDMPPPSPFSLSSGDRSTLEEEQWRRRRCGRWTLAGWTNAVRATNRRREEDKDMLWFSSSTLTLNLFWDTWLLLFSAESRRNFWRWMERALKWTYFFVNSFIFTLNIYVDIEIWSSTIHNGISICHGFRPFTKRELPGKNILAMNPFHIT